MSNIIRSTTELALHLVRPYIENASTVIDATCGNGHDTLALARMLWANKNVSLINNRTECCRIFGFDIQQDAIESSRKLLESEGFSVNVVSAGETVPLRAGNISLICDTHENMQQYLSQTGITEADVIMFNLGYLPGGDKQVTTNIDSTVRAFNTALSFLAKDGILSITMYSGHEAGAKEKAGLLRIAEGLDSRTYHVAYVSMPNQHRNPPEILLISKKL